MKQVYLLKPWNGNEASKTISVSNNVAFGLIDSGIARNVNSRDFLVKPQYGESKAFSGSPSISKPKSTTKGLKKNSSNE